MMKKFATVFFTMFFLMVVSLNCIAIRKVNISSAFATDQSNLISQNDSIKTLAHELCYGDEGVRKNRLAGSDGELACANFICDTMDNVANNFKLSSSNLLGFQEFYGEYVDGHIFKSQNLVFLKGTESKNKVIIGTSYDNYYGLKDENGENIEAEGFNQSVAGIIALINIAEKLNNVSLDFDLEIAFWGSENYSGLGSGTYRKGIDEEEAENILLYLNISEIGNAEQAYYYSGDYHQYSELFGLLNTAGIFQKYNPASDFSFSGIFSGYSNFGKTFANNNFEDAGIPTINIFSKPKSKFIQSTNNVQFSKDSIATAEENFGNGVYENIAQIVNSICLSLGSEDFVSVVTECDGNSWIQNNLFYFSLLVGLAVLLITFFVSLQYKKKLGIEALTYVENATNRISELDEE